MNVIEGDLDGSALRIAVVATRWNELVVDRLLEGALAALARHKVDEPTVVRVPGAWELPVVCRRLATDHDAVVALGTVIRGATDHYEIIAGQCAAGLQRIAVDTGVPVVFGVLTTDTLEQALERAGSKAGNKGAEAASTAVELATLLKRLG